MEENAQGRTLRYGMLGGGEGSFIGDVHRRAIALDSSAQLVCGCFSRNKENNLATGLKCGVEKDRIYGNYYEMAQAEAKRDDKMDFVVIVTPNSMHYMAAKAFLLHGFAVVCEKPLCFEADEARELKQLAEEKGLLFGVAYTYVGYPMLKQARQIIKSGQLGEITVVMAEYAQDWIAELYEKSGGNITAWRNDPIYAGLSACVGDIGTHIECAVSYITGLKIEKLCANLRSIGAGARLDTNGEIMVKYKGGASGMYWCSQVAVGGNNALKLRVYGTKGSVEWEHGQPEQLRLSLLGEPTRILERGRGYIDGSAARYLRIPAGHPEGFYEAFGNVYRAFAGALQKKLGGEALTTEDMDYAGVDEGLSGVRFIVACVASSEKNSAWVEL